VQRNASGIIAPPSTSPSTSPSAPAASVAGHPVEREAKFSVDIAFELPGLGDVSETVDALPELLLQATYFDTPDLGLWRQGITVRHRTGEGPDSGLWTAKLPAPGDGPTLDRSELSWPGSRDRPPEALKAALLGVVRHSALEVVAELTTRRRRLALRDGAGTSLAEIDDDHVTVVVDGRERGTFRQIEVELGPDGDPLLGPVTDRLSRAGAQPSNEPKLARALAVIVVLHSGHDIDLDDRARMGDVVRARIADGLHRMLDHDVHLRLDPDDLPAHSIHQARVATRRLRSDLLLLGAVVDPAWVTEVRIDLQWMGQVTPTCSVWSWRRPGGDRRRRCRWIATASTSSVPGWPPNVGSMPTCCARPWPATAISICSTGSRPRSGTCRPSGRVRRSPGIDHRPLEGRGRSCPDWWPSGGVPSTGRWVPVGGIPPNPSCTGCASGPSSSGMRRRPPNR
jgi:hypothetical protein